MNQENKKNKKIAIIGHTKGIGKAIAELYKSKTYEVVGLSKSNGFDIATQQEAIMTRLADCELVVINAFEGRGQLELLKRIYGLYNNYYK